MSKGFDVDDVDPRLMGLIDKMVSARAMWIVSVGWRSEEHTSNSSHSEISRMPSSA